MSHNYRKIKYEEEGPYGSTEEKYLYVDYNATSDYTTIYGNEGQYLITLSEWGNFSMEDAMVTIISNFSDPKLEYLGEGEYEKIFKNK